MTALPTLAEGLDWLEKHWDQQRAAPLRIHVRDIEGIGEMPKGDNCGKCLACTEGKSDGLGGHAFSSAFESVLTRDTNASAVMDTTVTCYHPTLPIGTSLWNCEGCAGTGIKTVRVSRYLYPTTRALHRLSLVRLETRQPHPYNLIRLLAASGFDAHKAHRMLSMTAVEYFGWDYGWDFAEAVFLQAIRKLHARYEEGPIATRTSAPSWLAISDSQRSAIEAGETAA